MSEQERGRWDRLDAMPTEALEELLRLDSQLPEGEGLGADTVLRAAEALARRESAGPGTVYPDVDQAWQRFLTKYYPCEPLALAEETPGAPGMAPPPPPAPEVAVRPHRGRNVRWLTRAALAAAAIAALLLATTVTASAFGYDLWENVTNWAGKHFTSWAKEPSIGGGTSSRNSGREDGEEFFSLQTALDSYGVEIPLVPTWVPERFTLNSVITSELPSSCTVTAYYTCEDTTLWIDYTIRTDKSYRNSRRQTEEENATPYEMGGVTHYVMTSARGESAKWLVDNYQCGITGDITREELLRMLDSIYE